MTPRDRACTALLASLALSWLAAGAALAESPSPVVGSPSPGASASPNDSYATDEDVQLVVDAPGVLANDNAGPQACVATFDGSLVAGALEVHPDGSFVYTPTANFNGTTTFTYGIATDTGSGCPTTMEGEPATVTISVNPVNDAPAAAPDSFTALKDHTLNIAAPGVLGNDSDVDGDSLAAVRKSSPRHGVVTLAVDGSFSYVPDGGYVGPDQFSYWATDGTDHSPQRIVSLTVVALPPAATPTPVPTATPVPETASPEPSPTESPIATESVGPTIAPEPTSPSASPSADPIIGGVVGQGSPPLVAIGALVLLLGLLAVAAVYFVRSQRAGDDGEVEHYRFAGDDPYDGSAGDELPDDR